MGSVILKEDNTVIAAKTAAENYDFILTEHEATTLSVSDLGIGETIPLHMKQGGSYRAMSLSGSVLNLSDATNYRRIEGPGQFRVAKGVTASAVSVHRD